MSPWDFIRDAYQGLGAIVTRYWPWLAAVVIGLILAGWLSKEAENAPLEELPPSSFPEWYDVREQAAGYLAKIQSDAKYKTEERGEYENY